MLSEMDIPNDFTPFRRSEMLRIDTNEIPGLAFAYKLNEIEFLVDFIVRYSLAAVRETTETKRLGIINLYNL
jgi:hypothetical protein